MKMHGNRFSESARPRSIGAAVALLALVATAGHAVAQTPAPRPVGTIEIGPGDVGDGSFKAGEYNGLAQKGVFGNGNIDWRSGTVYNSDSAVRWRIKGTDLGLETRSLTAQAGTQGKFRVTFGYDELRRNRSDTFETPYGGVGTNVLTLPGSWLVPTVAGSTGSNTAVNVVSARGLLLPIGVASYINTATNSPTMGGVLAPTAAQIAQIAAAANADLPLFQSADIFTKRRRFDAGFLYNFDPRWTVDASFHPEHKDGLKPMGTVSRNTGGDISTVIPDRIDAEHNQVDANLNFRGAHGFAQAGYYGSFFNNNIPSMSWQNWATATGTVNTMSSAPDNRFNQFTLAAGYNFSPTTRLIANGAYGRSTQNQTLLTDTTTPVVPVTSLNALVVNSTAYAKFSTRPWKRLSLAATYKYDERDNRTPVHIFQYADAGETPVPNASFAAGPNNPLGAVLAQNANANRPYSRRLNQTNLDADYALPGRQWIKGGYDFERINRFCSGSWIACADAAITNESTVRAEWRANVSPDLQARVGYAYSVRRTPDYNENAFLALVPYANVSPASATDGATAYSWMIANGWTGWGPALGYAPTAGNANVFFQNNNALVNLMYANNNRISELVGMRRYYVADRNRNKLRTSLSWQATESLAFQGGVDLNRDLYPDAVYGVQNAKNWALNLDGSYALPEDFSLSVFYSFENQRALTAGNSYTANSNASAISNGQPGAIGLAGNSCDGYTTLQQRNNNNKLDPCLNWAADMLDRVHTVGLGVRKPVGSLDLLSNVTFSRGRWDNNVTGGNWANNILNGPGAAPTTIAALFIAATPMPTIVTDTAEWRLSGSYALGHAQSVRVSYAYLHMRSSDPAYEGMQFGSAAGVLPTNEQPFNYSVNIIGVSYILSF